MNEKDIHKTWEYLGHSPVEIRVIDVTAGDVLLCELVETEDRLIQICRKFEGTGNIYAGINERRENFKIDGWAGAKKDDISAVNIIPIDIDSVRRDESLTPEQLKELQKQPSTAEELQCAIDAGKFIQLWFRENDFNVPPLAMSGNGSCLWVAVPSYKLTIDNRDVWEAKLKAFLVKINNIIPPELRDKVQVDTATFDVTRILKVVGTKSVKGTHTQERPHRVSYWIDEPVRVNDSKLLDYILSIDISPSKPHLKDAFTHQIRSESTQTVISIPKLSDYQNNTLKMALRHPYVVMARRRMNYRDLSASDWAFLCELRKEGITDRDMLIYALATCKDTKYQRDERANYIYRTVDNFIAKLEGLSLHEGRDRLEREMRQLTFEHKQIGNKTILIFIGASIGLGKTYNAQDLVARIREAGEKVLIIIPLHMLGDEWFHQLQVEYGIHDVIQLYGVTHEKVKCPFVEKAGWLLSIGHNQLFKQQYCKGICTMQNDCLHLNSLKWAKGASVLIATHSHSNVHHSFFKLRSLDNDIRSLIIVDEIPQLVNPVRLKREALRANLELFKILGKSNTDVPFDKFIELTTGLLNSLLARKNYEYPETLSGGITQKQVARADFLIASYYIDSKKQPTRNLIWDFAHLLNTLTPVKYDISEDVMIYRWRPEFRSHQSVVIMSGTTKSEYIEKQLKRPINQSIGENWHIRRENVKIVQMLNVTGGRNRLIRDSEENNLQAHIKEFLDFAFYKHAGQRIVIICSLGEGSPGAESKGSAKGRIIRMLYPIAQKHGRELIAVSTTDLQNGNIPDGLTEIPILHWGILGIDTLKGRFDVIIETNAHYFHPDSILRATYEKFDYDTSEIEPSKEKIKFHSVDQTIDLQQWVYPDELVNLEIEQSEKASIEQTEGRFLREDEIYKTIYRLHNVNIKPYPHRVYKSWDALFEYEFFPFVPAEILIDNLTGRDKDVWGWIQQNAQNRNFTGNEITQALGINVNHARYRHLGKLVSLELIEIIQQGGPGRENETIYRINPDVVRE